MTPRFKAFIPFIFKWEGGYDNDPGDPGGETKYGIDKRSHPKEDIKNLTKERATEIYFANYWQPVSAEIFPAGLGEAAFNCAVNCGLGRARQFLAKAKDAAAFISLQEDFYEALCQRRPKSRKYLRGWMNRTRDLREFLHLAQSGDK